MITVVAYRITASILDGCSTDYTSKTIIKLSILYKYPTMPSGNSRSCHFKTNKSYGDIISVQKISKFNIQLPAIILLVHFQLS